MERAISNRNFTAKSEERCALEARLRDTYDADIDRPADLPLKKAPTTRVPWLLVVTALMSLVWAATSIYLLIRAEQVRRPTAYLPNTAGVSPHIRGSSAPRPLLAVVPDSIRRKGLPRSEISLAADVRAAEERGGAALWRSHKTTGTRPDEAQLSASDSLKLHAQAGRKIDGWLMQVGWAFRIDKGMDPKYLLTQGPPGYRVTLRLPDTLAGYSIWLSGYNYDSWSRGFACANQNIEAVKPNDWVRVSGVLQQGSRMEWEWDKPDQSLSLGEMTISDIRTEGVVQK